jgi:DNA-directed RNA polymerase omega subunit
MLQKFSEFYSEFDLKSQSGGCTMVSTVPLEDLEKHANNVYEAIVVIAKRARQINDEQKRFIEQELGYDSTTDNPNAEDDADLEENHEDRRITPVKIFRLPKPTSISLDEMMNGKLQFQYTETQLEEN